MRRNFKRAMRQLRDNQSKGLPIKLDVICKQYKLTPYQQFVFKKSYEVTRADYIIKNHLMKTTGSKGHSREGADKKD